MAAFDIAEIGEITQQFIRLDRHLKYDSAVIERDQTHLLIQADNLFSSLYCQITDNVNVIRDWATLQRELHLKSKNKINRYLVYIVPEAIVKDNSLYRELSEAESNEFFFRKVFIDIPDHYNQKIIEKSLSKRIPIWMADRERTLREYVPFVESIIPNAELRHMLQSRTAPAVVQQIEGEESLEWLFAEGSEPSSAAGKSLTSPATIDASELSNRIDSLTLKEFRCFRDLHLELDGDIVVIFGKNGIGKTTVVDAIEFAIFNQIERLLYDPDLSTTRGGKYRPLINSDDPQTKEASVSLNGSSGEKRFEIKSTIQRDKCKTLLDGEAIGKRNIISMLTGNKELASRKEYLDILLHTHFLGQHSIRHFIYGNGRGNTEAVTRNRYDLISQMFGLGKIEAIKRRVHAVCNEIMEKKISPTRISIDGYRSALRSTQHKFGPKIRIEIEKKGYKAETDEVLAVYHQLLNDLKRRGSIELNTVVTDCQLPPSNFLKACQLIMQRLEGELKKLKSREADFNKLNALKGKLENIFSKTGLKTKSETATAFVSAIRSSLQANIKLLEDSRKARRHAQQQLSDLIERRTALIAFQQNYQEYRQFKKRERMLQQKVSELKRRNRSLVNKKDRIQSLHDQRESSKRKLEKEIKDLGQRISKIMSLIDRLSGINSKRVRFANNNRRIQALKKLMVKDLKSARLSDHKEGVSTPDALRDLLQRTDHFLQSDRFICPCCGVPYAQKKELSGRIVRQLKVGKYKEDLLEFIIRVDSRHQQMAAEAVEQLNEVRRKELLVLEKENAAFSKEIDDYVTSAASIMRKRSPSAKELQNLLLKHGGQLEKFRKRAMRLTTEGLRERLQNLENEIRSLGLESSEIALAEASQQLSKIIKSVEQILSAKEREKSESIAKKISVLNQETTACQSQVAELDHTIAQKGFLEDRFEEISKDVIELESILSKYDATATNLTSLQMQLHESSATKQKPYYEYLERVSDLEKLFGLLSTDDESSRIRSEIDNLESQTQRWQTCYDNMKKLAEDLASSSLAGLEKSLEQYSPLINEIYKKFTRHEFFNEVQLKPQVTRGQRKRSLYIQLKNYSGETQYTPASYLSEAQLNILALSIFLTRVIYQNVSIFQTVIIDDPIQQMDDMNAMSFIDILMGLSQAGKQIIVTTCDTEFFALVCQKMSQLAPQSGKKFLSIDLRSVAGRPVVPTVN